MMQDVMGFAIAPFWRASNLCVAVCRTRAVRMVSNADMLRAAAAGDVAFLSQKGRSLATPVIGIVDNKGATAMHIAAGADHADAVASLFEIARGAGGATIQFGHDQTAAVAFANARDESGATPLHYAARTGAVRAMRRLLMLGANPALQDNDGATPLDAACNAEVVAVLS